MNLLLAVILPLVDPPPEPEDVKAGWVAFAIFLGLAVAVVFLAFSLTKHLKKAKANFDAGDKDAEEPASNGVPSSDEDR